MLTGVTAWYREGGPLGRDELAAIYWEMVRGAVGAPAGQRLVPARETG
jgi:hypothetical protein